MKNTFLTLTDRSWFNFLVLLPIIFYQMFTFLIFRIASLFSLGDELRQLDTGLLVTAFGNGLRFDGVVLGFMLAMVWVTTFLFPFRLLTYLRMLVSLLWTAVLLVMMFDFYQFKQTGRRIRWAELQPELPLNKDIESIFYLLLIVMLLLFVARISHKKSYDIENKLYAQLPADRVFDFSAFAKVFLPFILIAVLARGSFSEHHLRREDSEVTPSARANEWIFNPLWTFDKNE